MIRWFTYILHAVTSPASWDVSLVTLTNYSRSAYWSSIVENSQFGCVLDFLDTIIHTVCTFVTIFMEIRSNPFKLLFHGSGGLVHSNWYSFSTKLGLIANVPNVFLLRKCVHIRYVHRNHAIVQIHTCSTVFMQGLGELLSWIM